MPTFDVEIGGKPFEIDAPDMASAQAALSQYIKPEAPITADALVRQAVAGIPVVGGLGNRFAAAMDALTNPILSRGSTAPNFGQRYSENLAAEQAKDIAFQEANPVTSLMAQLAGGS